jgi:hypothetical protein
MHARTDELWVSVQFGRLDWIPARLRIWLTHPCPFRVPVRFPQQRQTKPSEQAARDARRRRRGWRRERPQASASIVLLGGIESDAIDRVVAPRARPHASGQPERASRVHARLDPQMSFRCVVERVVAAPRRTPAGSAPRCSSDASSSSLYREDSAIFLSKWRSRRECRARQTIGDVAVRDVDDQVKIVPCMRGPSQILLLVRSSSRSSYGAGTSCRRRCTWGCVH